jgi:hypothetical protein
MNRDSIVFIPTKSGQFLKYKVLSWHPEFSAFTGTRIYTTRCDSPVTKPVIMSSNGALTEAQMAEERLHLKLENAAIKYADVIAAIAEVGMDHNKIADKLNLLSVVAYNKLAAVRRMKLV